MTPPELSFWLAVLYHISRVSTMGTVRALTVISAHQSPDKMGTHLMARFRAVPL